MFKAISCRDVGSHDLGFNIRGLKVFKLQHVGFLSSKNSGLGILILGFHAL
jgi:hypothetical protein